MIKWVVFLGQKSIAKWSERVAQKLSKTLGLAILTAARGALNFFRLTREDNGIGWGWLRLVQADWILLTWLNSFEKEPIWDGIVFMRAQQISPKRQAEKNTSLDFVKPNYDFQIRTPKQRKNVATKEKNWECRQKRRKNPLHLTWSFGTTINKVDAHLTWSLQTMIRME